MAYLEVQVPNRPPFQVALGERPLRIGRAHDQDLCLRDFTVSSRHAEIILNGHGWKIVDAGSRNGTAVNGERLRERDLAPGDEIAIGTATITFRDAPASAPAVEPAPVEPDLDDLFAGRLLVPLADIESRLTRLATLQKTVSLLFKLGRDLNHLDGVDRFLQRLAEIVEEAVLPDRVFLLLTDPKTGDLVLRASRGYRPEAGGRIAVSSTILDRAMLGRVAVLTQDAIADPRFRDAESVELNRVRGVICVPLVEGGDLGAIYVDSRRPERFAVEDLHLVGAVAAHASAALRNLQLFENVRRFNRELSAEREALIARVQELEARLGGSSGPAAGP